MSDYCVHCTCSLRNVAELGEPAVFGTPAGFDLCIECYWSEDAEIEAAGTNDLPDRLARYKANFEANG